MRADKLHVLHNPRSVKHHAEASDLFVKDSTLVFNLLTKDTNLPLQLSLSQRSIRLLYLFSYPALQYILQHQRPLSQVAPFRLNRNCTNQAGSFEKGHCPEPFRKAVRDQTQLLRFCNKLACCRSGNLCTMCRCADVSVVRDPHASFTVIGCCLCRGFARICGCTGLTEHHRSLHISHNLYTRTSQVEFWMLRRASPGWRVERRCG
ncbi:hypothetical protein BJ742DRAFT_829417 [Cladochytrium replicatum]|nr:hypothetical protein BJ742DRAFT_829417 [Cladochytrium replicatum]